MYYCRYCCNASMSAIVYSSESQMNGRATLPQLASHLPWPQALLGFAVLKNPLVQVGGWQLR